MAFQGKKLINDPNDVVTEFIKGLVETYPRLRYLDGFPKVKVVLRADVSSAAYDKVAIISDICTEEPPRGGTPAGNDQISQENALEAMSSTMSFGLVLQTLSLLDTTSTSTWDTIFFLVAVAAAEFAFVFSVVSSVIKRRTDIRKLADWMLLSSFGFDIVCVLFQAARLVPVYFMPVVYSAGLLVSVIFVVILYQNYKRQ